MTTKAKPLHFFIGIKFNSGFYYAWKLTLTSSPHPTATATPLSSPLTSASLVILELEHLPLPPLATGVGILCISISITTAVAVAADMPDACMPRLGTSKRERVPITYIFTYIIIVLPYYY